MLQIDCPWCGARDESEFSYGGEAHLTRPLQPENLSDEQWADYLFLRTNSKGLFREMWNHSSGCRRWFNVERDTATYELKSVYHIGAQAPAGDAGGGDE